MDITLNAGSINTHSSILSNQNSALKSFFVENIANFTDIKANFSILLVFIGILDFTSVVLSRSHIVSGNYFETNSERIHVRIWTDMYSSTINVRRYSYSFFNMDIDVLNYSIQYSICVGLHVAFTNSCCLISNESICSNLSAEDVNT